MTYELPLPLHIRSLFASLPFVLFVTTVQLRATALLPAISAGSFHASDEAAQCSVASRIQAGVCFNHSEQEERTGTGG